MDMDLERLSAKDILDLEILEKEGRKNGYAEAYTGV